MRVLIVQIQDIALYIMSELECRVVESEASCLLSKIGSLKPLHQVGVSGTIWLVGTAPVTQNNIINRKKS